MTVLPGGEAATAPTEPARAAYRDSTAVAAASKPEVESKVAQKAQQGIIPFLVALAFGGLLALVMPCVWPMVPITVNFFVNEGQAQNGKSTVGLAITYCLAIIGVFTSVGVLCAFFFLASSLQRLANNPWLNFAVAGLFMSSKPEGLAGKRHFAGLSAEPAERHCRERADRFGDRRT